MAKSASLFPHFIRIFSAGILWTSLLLLVAVNVYAKTVLVPESFPFMIAVMSSPSSRDTHMSLAQKLWSLGFLIAAQRELAVSTALPSTGLNTETPSNVLGITSLQDLQAQWKREPEVLTQAYQYWQSVVRDKPDYRAGLVYTAALAYQLSRTNEGKAYISRAQVLDPNNTNVQGLAPLFFER